MGGERVVSMIRYNLKTKVVESKSWLSVQVKNHKMKKKLTWYTRNEPQRPQNTKGSESFDVESFNL